MAKRSPRYENDYNYIERQPRNKSNWNYSGNAGSNPGSGNRAYAAGSGDSYYGRPKSRTAPVRPSGNSYARGRHKKKKSKGGLIAVLVILVLLLAGLAVYVWKSRLPEPVEQVAEVVKPLPDAPKVAATASIGATGDILLHLPILNAHETYDGYDFSPCFSNVSRVYDQVDYMIANLEVTLGGTESGEYTSYPAFNSPDEIVPALKNAGVDMCLTANNHSNDTGYYGMMRTLDVLDDYGIDHLGSREETDESYIFVKDINGIRLGMVCYTYDTREYTEGEKSLNFNYLSDEAVQKICTFNYEYLDEFYDELAQQLYYMDMLNVDSKIVFMHWGTEYQDYPNDYQQTDIAQRLCDMGVDVIIGGHPHVIQEFETLTGANGHETVCLYSMGNELSNQRTDLMIDEDGGRGYTEDGLVIQVTFEKFNNGNTKIGAVNIVPTWVQMDGNGYQISGLKININASADT